jgi:hypothetical protein
MTCFAALLLVGCDTTPIYDGSIPESPQRWPDDVQTCGTAAYALLPLNLVVTLAKFPVLPINRAGCGFYLNGHSVLLLNSDDIRQGPMRVDSTGIGNIYHVYYYVQFFRNDRFYLDTPDRNGHTNQLYNPHWVHRTPATVQYPETWTYNKLIFDRIEMINGLKWRHFMFWEYSSLSSAPDMPALSVASKESGSRGSAALLYPVPVVPVSQPDALTLVGEVYEHMVDNNHRMLVYGHFDRPVVQDAHWLAVRRAMLKELVDVVTITPLTPERLERFKAENSAAKNNTKD